MISSYLLIGFGVYLGLLPSRLDSIIQVGWTGGVIGFVLTVVGWPIAIYNNLENY